MIDINTIFTAYKQRLIENKEMNTDVFLTEFEIPDDSKSTMLNALNVMLKTDSSTSNQSSNSINTVGSSQLLESVPTNDPNAGKTVQQPAHIESQPIENTNSVESLSPYIIEQTSIKPTIVNPIDVLKSKDNWSELTSSSNEFKIYEVIATQDTVFIMGLVLDEDGLAIPMKWNMLGLDVNNVHNIQFNPKFAIGEQIIVANSSESIYVRVFKEFTDKKYVTYNDIVNKDNQFDSWLYAIPWNIYNNILQSE